MSERKPNAFPHGLLNKSKAERLEYFRAFTVKHPLLLKAYEELRCAIRDSNPGSIIFIYGPTGVGKTTLLERIEKNLKEILVTDLEKDRERIPSAKVLLVAPTSGNFDWKDYFIRLLIELKEPLVNDKLAMNQWKKPHPVRANNISDLRFTSDDKPGIRPLRFSSEQTLLHRRPLAVLIDDAQHFGIISSGRKLLDQLNTIKSLADKSSVTHVLCGTYEVIPLRNLNGQLSRRSIDVHFSRYHAEDEVQSQEFINALYSFQQHLPLAKAPDLISRWDYFYERSLGCVGVLKDWLTRSLALAIEDDKPTLPLSYLERRVLSVRQCTTIFNEIIMGEKELVETEESQKVLRRNLGLTMELAQKAQQESSSDEPLLSISPKRPRQRVGTRKPKRDKVGRKIA